jgi:hypothetical protein
MFVWGADSLEIKTHLMDYFINPFFLFLALLLLIVLLLSSCARKTNDVCSSSRTQY